MLKPLSSILSLSSLYSIFQASLGAFSCRQKFVRDYVKPSLGDKVLDIGCGPGDLLAHLSDIEYIGFDYSSDYFSSARLKYGHLGKFYCQDVSEISVGQTDCFDIVLAVGIIHHLDNSKALDLCRLANSLLKPGGKLVTFDGVFGEDQSEIARYIIAQDRGQYVRTKEGYLSITSQVFSDIKVSIRHDLLRIPYTHLILECFK